MQKGTVLNLRKFNFLKSLGKNKTVIFMLLLFVAGLLFGNFSCSGQSKLFSFFANGFTKYISIRQSTVFWKIFLNSFSNFFTVLIGFFIFGTTLLGVTLIPLAIFGWGFWYGSISAYLCSEYALKGIAFNTVILIPPILCFSICLFFAARESFGFSFNLAKLTLPSSMPVKLFIQFKAFCNKYLILIFVTVISSLIDAAMSVTFIHFFDF